MVVIDASHKIIVTGLGKTGKTSLLERYVEKSFTPKYTLTVVAAFYMKIVEASGKKIFLKFWDIPGLEAIGPTRQALYWYASGFALCFDLTDLATLIALREVVLEEVLPVVEQGKAKNLSSVLIGCKSDLPQTINNNEIKRFQEELSSKFGFEVPYFATSAKTGENIDLIFSKLTELLLKNEK
ncbi:MAG: Rab family GTPase [Candidatus Hodarchaeota archaeon]